MKLKEIHSDARGKITLLTEDMKWDEVTIFTTKAGYARGGCIHENSLEYSSIMQGHVIYQIGDKHVDCYVGDTVKIPAGEPHYFISVTDSIVLEWGATPEEKKEKHEVFRHIVDNFNKGKM